MTIPQMNDSGKLIHLLRMEGLTAEYINSILDSAESLIDTQGRIRSSECLKGKTVATLFFEPSTRTRSTFELAAKKLGAWVLNLDIERASVQKGETLEDTFSTLLAMQCDAVVVRHSQAGTADRLADLAGGAVVLNAGDGAQAHPTQALLDLFTLRKHVGLRPDLKIAIVGDILHSRVARSQVTGLETMGIRDIRLVAPTALMPSTQLGQHTQQFTTLETGIAGADVIITLRLQHERMQSLKIQAVDYFETFGITEAKLKKLAPKAWIMHPGPINREVEIASEVADGERSLILKQVTYGVAVRMALLKALLE